MSRFNNDDDIFAGIECAVEKLNHYYDKISPMVGIALILNPSMKKDFLRDSLSWEDEWVDDVMEQFHSSFTYYKGKAIGSLALPNVASAKHLGGNVALSEFAEYRKRKRASNAPASFENILYTKFNVSQRYSNAPLAPDDVNILEFWKANRFNYPILAAMAKDYLTVQASSVPSERAFSSGTDLVTADRCSLGGRTIEMTQFLKFNL
jgi:hypothetical protein